MEIIDHVEGEEKRMEGHVIDEVLWSVYNIWFYWSITEECEKLVMEPSVLQTIQLLPVVGYETTSKRLQWMINILGGGVCIHLWQEILCSTSVAGHLCFYPSVLPWEGVGGLYHQTKHAFRWEGFQISKLLMYGRKMRDIIIAESVIEWLKLTFLEKILENLGWWWWMLRRKIGRTRKVWAFVVNKKGVDC